MTGPPAGSSWAVVVPTIGRPSLGRLLESLAAQQPAPAEVVVVDDRPQPWPPLHLGEVPGARVLTSGGRGPAAARNTGWRATSAPWVVFLDDDVLLPEGWSAALVADLASAPPGTGGSSGRIRVPLPADRAPTDAERNTAGLERAAWATADMAYARAALRGVGGFDERFRRAYREDADLAVRVRAAGWELVGGDRYVQHPVRSEGRWASISRQRGNADDVLMRYRHGRGWRRAAQAPRGTFRRHALTTLSAGTAVAAALAGRPRAAAAGAVGWAALTADFARRRIAPGPGTPGEVLTMLVTSAAIPPLAVYWRAAGHLRHHRVRPFRREPVAAVLFDRDGTLLHDVPYNGDPARVRPVDGAADALARLRRLGIPVGVVTNQSGIGRGLITGAEEQAVEGRVEELLGRFDTWQVCPHGPGDGCECRKPSPGMVLAAASTLGVPASGVVMVGDIADDVRAARDAGARGILVPNRQTDPDDLVQVDEVADSLCTAVDRVLGLR